jgi:hypothetical protein
LTARKAGVWQWEYLTVYLSGELDFPDAVDHQEVMIWAGKSITQQINERAALGWELIDLRWLSDLDMMVTFKRRKQGTGE